MHFLFVIWIFYAHFSLQVYGQMFQEYFLFLSPTLKVHQSKKKKLTGICLIM